MLMDQLIATKQMVRFEDERGGRWYDTVAYPVIVGSGEVSRIAIISRDITDRKTAEDALRESEERYRQLVDTSPDSVIIHGEGKILYLNPAALTLLGAADSREITGKNTLDFVHPEYRDVIREDIEKILCGETLLPREVPVLRSDGTTIMAESRAVKTTFRGEPALQVILRDVTERRQREMALRDSEEKYRTLVNRANDLICVIQDGVIKMCNPSLTEAFGTSSERILGRPFTGFIDEESLPLVADRYHRRIAGESPPSLYQMMLKRRDGSRARVEVNASLISYEGKPADLVIIREINDRHRHRRNREWRDDPGPDQPPGP